MLWNEHSVLIAVTDVLEGSTFCVDCRDRCCGRKEVNFVLITVTDAVEADVWQHFREYGEVENVRLVRDRNTSIGKGFGYVLFKVSEHQHQHQIVL